MEKLMELLNTNITVYGFNLIMFFLMVSVILLHFFKSRFRGWHPIETAPKDGTHILVIYHHTINKYASDYFQGVAFFNSGSSYFGRLPTGWIIDHAPLQYYGDARLIKWREIPTLYSGIILKVGGPEILNKGDQDE